MLRKQEIKLAKILVVILTISLFINYLYSPPNFSAMEDVKERKIAFVDYLKPIINDVNQQRASERQELKSLYADLTSGKTLGYLERRKLESWSERYAIEFQPDNLTANAKRLLLHLDEIPTSMVLAQAAVESAWGTSRFVREGNNFFGQWCFTRGCGMVPNAIAKGATHEVQEFSSTEDALYTYFQNINRHPAYKQVRYIRALARKAGKPLSGLAMVGGLQKYSERGQVYIEQLRSVIRFNNFE